MRRERHPSSWLRGLLLLLLGGLVGANATYFVMSRGAAQRGTTNTGERIETPLPVQFPNDGDAILAAFSGRR